MGLDSLTPEKSGLKKAKHIMEKRRRARINASLAELKCLLPGGGRQGTCSIKMEKADILERAVEHLKLLTARCCSEDDQIQSLCGKFHDPRDTILENYDKGYRECLDDVDSYLLRMHIDDPELREQILGQFASRKARLKQSPTFRKKTRGGGVSVKRCGEGPGARGKGVAERRTGRLELLSYRPTHSPADSTTPEYVEDDVVEIDMEDISDDGKCFNESSEVKNEDNNNNNNFASGGEEEKLKLNSRTGERSVEKKPTVPSVKARPLQSKQSSRPNGSPVGHGQIHKYPPQNIIIVANQHDVFHHSQEETRPNPVTIKTKVCNDSSDELKSYAVGGQSHTGPKGESSCVGDRKLSVNKNASPACSASSSYPVPTSQQLSIVIPAGFLSSSLLRPCLIPLSRQPYQMTLPGSKPSVHAQIGTPSKQGLPLATVHVSGKHVMSETGFTMMQQPKTTSCTAKSNLLVTQLCQPMTSAFTQANHVTGREAQNAQSVHLTDSDTALKQPIDSRRNEGTGCSPERTQRNAEARPAPENSGNPEGNEREESHTSMWRPW